MIRVLFICTANICRSPYASQVLQEELAGSDWQRIRVESAGTNAIVGAPVCNFAIRRIPQSPSHKARQVTSSMIESFDLILTAERHHRGVVATLSPKSLARVFTLAEAARLIKANAAPTSALIVAGDHSLDLRFSRWVNRLDQSRGPSIPTSAGFGRHFKRSVSPEFDIDDGHFQSQRLHRRTLDLVADCTKAIASQIRKL